MSYPTTGASHPSCNGAKPECGSHPFCPPLILIANRLDHFPSEFFLEQSRYPADPNSPPEPTRLSPFATSLASADFCRCVASEFPRTASPSSQM